MFFYMPILGWHMASMKCVAVKTEQQIHSRGRDRDSAIAIDSSDDEGA